MKSLVFYREKLEVGDQMIYNLRVVLWRAEVLIKILPFWTTHLVVPSSKNGCIWLHITSPPVKLIVWAEGPIQDICALSN